MLDALDAGGRDHLTAVKRDLHRERLIAKSAGPLKVWRAPEPPPGCSGARAAAEAAATREWLRIAEAEERELAAARGRLVAPDPGPEFGGVDKP